MVTTCLCSTQHLFVHSIETLPEHVVLHRVHAILPFSAYTHASVVLIVCNAAAAQRSALTHDQCSRQTAPSAQCGVDCM